ncbi:hypothetical protein POTOM_017436 [Populus tomentosa]|uniref:Ninja-family protein n=1 Tax=Populus tomentosa TaxID=118781 RepID=A0A8X7ZYW5_POPTO|nr:hypothetical protein POTOM_017436 [Populus tomentosa]
MFGFSSYWNLKLLVLDNIHGDGISVPSQISKSGLFCKFSIKVIFTSVLFLVFALIIYQMVQTEKLQNIETQQQHNNISMFNNFPKDLLPRFISGNLCNHKLNGEEDVELSLGLSLNGRFGVDPKAKKINKSRPSSIAADFVNPLRENGNGSSFVVPNMESTNLSGTCSLPTETEEEWRKRKEMQSVRRMEAKGKRSEKQNFKAVKDKNRGEEDDQSENGTTGNHHQKEFLKSFNGLFGVAIEGLLTQAEVAPPPLLLTSQGTASSGMTEFESQPVKDAVPMFREKSMKALLFDVGMFCSGKSVLSAKQYSEGMNKCVESRSPVSVQSLSECEQKSIIAPRLALAEKLGFPAGVAMEKNGSNKLIVAENGTKEAVRNVLEDMPYVSTKGVGPNRKQIEGFLYQYRKGEEVRIVCVCHGSFLSAAEFVKHAGDGDVEQPLKHIVVNPPPFFFNMFSIIIAAKLNQLLYVGLIAGCKAGQLMKDARTDSRKISRFGGFIKQMETEIHLYTVANEYLHSFADSSMRPPRGGTA